MENQFPNAHNLPTVVPLIPLTDAVLMPKTMISMTLSLADHMSLFALADSNTAHDSYVGIVQSADIPLPPDHQNEPMLYKTGCLGRVLDITQTPEGDFSVTIVGECRFKLLSATDAQIDSGSFRAAKVDYSPYTVDLIEEVDIQLNRDYLMQVIHVYFRTVGIELNWEKIQLLSNSKLIAALIMECPLPVSEKQAIIDEVSLQKQAQLLQTFLEHAILANAYSQSSSHSIH